MSNADNIPRATIDRIEGGVLSGTSNCTTLILRVNDAAAARVVVTGTDADGPGVWRVDLKALAPAHLLRDEMEIELAASVAARHALASTRIATADVAPARAAKPRDGEFEGYLDECENGRARGWIWRPSDPRRPQTVYVYVGERFAGAYVADRSRPDLAALGKGEGRHGFDIDLGAFAANAPAARIRVVSADPYGWELRASAPARTRRFPSLFGRKSIGRIGSTRDFVAAIADEPPYPKKVFDIAKVAGAKMPDPFAAEYAIMALEFVRREAVALGERISAARPAERPALERQLVRVEYQMKRLAALGETVVSSQKLLAEIAAARKRGPDAR